jgi:TIR domain
VVPGLLVLSYAGSASCRTLGRDDRAAGGRPNCAGPDRCEGVRLADIFISYTAADRDWAFWIGQELEKLGHLPHIHEWEISGGGDIAAWMEERHDRADHILCVISEAYLTKPYSSWERRAAQWASATDRPNFALPVFIEDCKPPTLLAQVRRCDLAGLSEDALRRHIKGPTGRA